MASENEELTDQTAENRIMPSEETDNVISEDNVDVSFINIIS